MERRNIMEPANRRVVRNGYQTIYQLEFWGRLWHRHWGAATENFPGSTHTGIHTECRRAIYNELDGRL